MMRAEGLGVAKGIGGSGKGMGRESGTMERGERREVGGREKEKMGTYRGEPQAFLYSSPARRSLNSSFVTKGDQT
jgi:hypothetical protein